MGAKNLNRKIIIFNTIFGTILLVVSIFLYSKFPEIILNKIVFLDNTTIYENTCNLFILQVSLLISIFLFSLRWVQHGKTLLSTNKFICYYRF